MTGAGIDQVRLSRQRSLGNLAIFGVATVGIVVFLLPDLISGAVPPGSVNGILRILGIAIGGGACLAIAASQLRLLLDRRPGLAIVGDRLELHPFWMSGRSVALAQIAAVTFEEYEFFMNNTTHSRRHRLRVDLKPGAGDGKPLYFETWRLAGGDTAGEAFGAQLARRAGLALETAIA